MSVHDGHSPCSPDCIQRSALLVDTFCLPYPPTWVSEDQGEYVWMVYRAHEGFTPAFALVWADDPCAAGEIAEELSSGRIDDSAIVRMVGNS